MSHKAQMSPMSHGYVTLALCCTNGKGAKLGEGEGAKLGEGEGAKLGEGERD
jgi:hypothetical protein